MEAEYYPNVDPEYYLNTGGEYYPDAGLAHAFLLSVVAEEPCPATLPVLGELDTFVLSVGAEPLGGRLHPSQVIVDTGATESACGIRSMEKLRVFRMPL